MLTALLIFLILGFVCWKLSKYFSRLSDNMEKEREEREYREEILSGNIQDIRDCLCTDEDNESTSKSLVEELKKVTGEHRAREEQLTKDSEAVEQLIKESDPSEGQV